LGTFALTGLWRLLNSVARLLNVHAQSGHIAAQLRIDLIAVRVGSLGDDCVDARRAWTKQREIGPEGAVLVRPDRYIGFRSAGGTDNHWWRLCIESCIWRRFELPLMRR
jgi:hypothetical protein